MPSVSRVAAAAPKARVTDLIEVTVLENDPTLKASDTAFGFKVTGKAANNGSVASFMKLSFDRRAVTLSVSKGDDGATLFAKLQKALPNGYEARLLENPKSNPPQVTIGIARKGGPSPAADISKLPTSIAANSASASVQSSLWINAMPGASRPNAIARVTVQGTGFADKPPRFQVKSIDVYEKGTHQKVATIFNPKLVESETVWGQKSQSYRLEIPKKELDRTRQYTFVVNTGINDSKPQQVRSEYVKLTTVH